MLTPAHQRTLDFIHRYWREQGRSPSFAEIAEGIGIRSRGVIHRYVRVLIQTGYVMQQPGRKRALELTGQGCSKPYTIPFLGRIAAGRPVEAIPGQEALDLTTFFIGADRYALQVRGDSMIEAGILDGDTVIIDARYEADEGAIVVALIDEDEATLKRLSYRKDGSIQLTPANTTMAPMIYSADRVRIQGVVVSVLRSYR